MLKSIRKIGLLVSSFALACSVALGVALLPKTVATADDGMTISTTDLVKSSTMTVTPAYENAGLYIEKTANKQSATMQGSFNGDLTIEYSLVSAGARSYFDFYNLDNQLVFSVVRYGPEVNKDVAYASGAYISYKANASASKSYAYLNKSKELIDTATEPTGATNRKQLYAGAMPIVYATTIEKSGVGYITLDWADDGMLTIKMPYSKNNVVSEETIATIDLSGWGDVASAYYLKFNYDTSYNYQANVLLRSVNGVSLAGETVAVTKPTTAITYEGETEVNGVATINLAKGENLGNFIATKPATVVGGNWTVGAAEDETFSYAEDFSSKNSGTYAISVENGGFTKLYNVVVNGVIATSDLVKSSTMTVTPAYENAGLYLEKTANKQSATMAGTFNGDLTIEYSLQSAGARSYFDFYNSNNQLVFSVVRYGPFGDKDVAYASGAYISYKANADASKQYAYLNASKEMVNTSTEPIGDNRKSLYGGAMPIVYATTLEKSGVGYITLDWSDNGSLTVKIPYSKNNVVTEETIATIDLSSWEGLSSAYSLKFNYDTSYNYQANVLLRSVNGVSLAGETISAVKIASSVSDIAYTGASNNEIVVSQNAMLGNFVATADYVVAGNWTVEVDEEFAVDASTYSTATLGDNTLTVTNENYSEDFNLKVIYKTMEDLDLEMAYGASVRIGSSDGHNGIRFSMCIEDYEAWQASIGEGQYYTSVSYGMFIMPSDYYTATGAYTLENLFGEKAIYTWKNKAEAYGTTQILHRSGSQMFWDEKNSWWSFNYSITDIHKDNIGRDFVALGYVELTLSDGSVVRKLAQFNEGNIANNTRSAYTVAKKAIEAGIDETSALWLKTNYIDVVEKPTVEE